MNTPNLAACVTPWTRGDALDEDALGRQLRFLGKRNMGVCLGAFGNGEGLLLEPQERRRVYEIGVRELGGKVPVFAVSLGYTSTADMIRQAQEAVALGVDGVQLYPPRPGPVAAAVSAQMVEAFYRDICEAVRGPIVLGLQSDLMPEARFPLDLIGRLLADYPHIRAINCTTGDESQLTAVARAFGARLPVRCAGLPMLLANLEAGGTGYVGAEGNYAPTWLNEITAAHAKGDAAAARAALERLKRLSAAVRRYPVRGEKMAVHLLGRIEPHARKPYLPLGAEDEARILTALREAGILEMEREG